MTPLRHYVHPSIVSSRRPIDIALIGAGGTGSQVLSGLARMNQALKALGSPGLHVRVFDGDSVSTSNVGRQLFSPSDVGKNKAVVLVTRLNMFFGTSWEAYAFNVSKGLRLPGGIIISAVDDVEARYLVRDIGKNSGIVYWVDTGNTADTGQVVLGTFDKVDQPREVVPVLSPPCSRSLPGDYGGGIPKALPGPKLFAPGVPHETGPLHQPVGGHLRAGDHLEDVQIWAGKGARRLRQPQHHDRPASSRQSCCLGIDGLETAETEERSTSESGITNNMIFKGGSGHPFLLGLVVGLL